MSENDPYVTKCSTLDMKSDEFSRKKSGNKLLTIARDPKTFQTDSNSKYLMWQDSRRWERFVSNN